jgi:hypothetical protein
MKVYAVFYSEGGEEVLNSIFVNEEKARSYIEQMHAITDIGWYHEELEVQE